MAPPNGAARHRKTGSVKPAIPLPHVKRQAAAAAAANKTANPPANKTKDAPSTTVAKAKDQQKPEKTPTATAEQASHTRTNSSITSSSAATTNNTNELSDETISSTKDEKAPPAVVRSDNLKNGHRCDDQPPSSTKGLTNGVSQAEASRTDHSAGNPGASRQPATTVSPTRYQLPPPFKPASRLPNPVGHVDDNRDSRPPVVNGRSHLHCSHPSNGAVHFGGFHSSTSSSPAPPVSGGIAPPSGMPLPDGQQPYMSNAGNGYPPAMPPGLGMMAVGPYENYRYGRPGMGYPSADPYQQQYGNNFPPSDPQGFHDARLPIPPEEGGVFHALPSGPRNDASMFGDNATSQNFPSSHNYPGTNFHQPLPQLPTISHHGTMDAAVYLGQLFDNYRYADCSLELRRQGDEHSLVRIAGLRAILARSPALDYALQKQSQMPVPQTLILETNDKWVRPDAFYIAVQQFYGHPLLPVPDPRFTMTAAGSASDQFDFALAYAAAGHILRWGPVVRRGCEIASGLLTLETIEKAMEFALEDYQDKGLHEDFKYGDGSRILLHYVVTFTASNLPGNFTLDTSVTDTQGHTRLPYDVPTPPKSRASNASDASNPTSPVIVRGHFVSHSKSLSQSHPNIQFGDLSLANGMGDLSVEDGTNGQPHETPKTSEQVSTVVSTVYSRILLYLPFVYLKMLVEFGRGNPNGWGNPDVRFRVIQEAVNEREARRQRALQAVYSGQVADFESVEACLRSPDPPQDNAWAVLGWREVFTLDSEGPSIRREWTPMTKGGTIVKSEYPAKAEYPVKADYP